MQPLPARRRSRQPAQGQGGGSTTPAQRGGRAATWRQRGPAAARRHSPAPPPLLPCPSPLRSILYATNQLPTLEVGQRRFAVIEASALPAGYDAAQMDELWDVSCEKETHEAL